LLRNDDARPALSGTGAKNGGNPKPGALKTFDIKTGTPKASY
jgi:hypothetical protein